MHQIPLAYSLAVAGVKVFITGAQVHMSIGLRSRLKGHGPLLQNSVSALFLVAAAGLVASSGLFGSERLWLTGWQPPAFLRDLSTIWVAGSFVAYLMYIAYRGVRRLAGKQPGMEIQARGSGELDSGNIQIARRDLLAQAGQAALVAPFAAAGYGTFIGRTDFDVREVEIAIPNLPDSLNGVRLAQLTDIHFGADLSAKELERVVAMANESRPHLALVTGDLITRAGDPLEKCIDILSHLKADAGLWACLGNHERYAESEEHCQAYARKLGIEFLRHQSQTLRFGDSRLNLCGVDYQRTSRPYLQDAQRLIRKDAVNVLLSHNPDVFPVAARLGYDLVVAGHTHGGQVTVEIVEQWVNPGHFFTPYVAGEYQLDQSTLYVSRGIGTVNLAMRVGALPEISLLTLRRA